MSAGVEAESITHEKFNVRSQLHDFVDNKGVILACGTSIKGRHQSESGLSADIYNDGFPQHGEWVEDKVFTF